MQINCPQCKRDYRPKIDRLASRKGYLQCGGCGLIYKPSLYCSEHPDNGNNKVTLKKSGTVTSSQSSESTDCETRHGGDSDYANTNTSEAGDPNTITPDLPDVSGTAVSHAMDQSKVVAQNEAEQSPTIPTEKVTGKKTEIALEELLFPDENPRSAGVHEALLDAAKASPNPRPEPPPRQRVSLWLPLSVILIATTIFQLQHFYFSSLSLSPTFRPVIEFICEFSKCQLPDPDARDYLNLSNLELTLPEIDAKTLRLSLRLSNSSPRPQAFPAIKILLLNQQQSPIESREYPPSNYRRPRNLTMIPPQKHADIHLKLADVTPQAVEFSVSLLPAK